MDQLRRLDQFSEQCSQNARSTASVPWAIALRIAHLRCQVNEILMPGFPYIPDDICAGCVTKDIWLRAAFQHLLVYCLTIKGKELLV